MLEAGFGIRTCDEVDERPLSRVDDLEWRILRALQKEKIEIRIQVQRSRGTIQVSKQMRAQMPKTFDTKLITSSMQ